jgi:PQQ-like domain
MYTTKLFSKNNKKSVFALVLMLTIAVSTLFAFLPSANAHTPPWNVPTTAYVCCTPDPIGVGQTTTIVVWLDRYSPMAGGGVGQRWDGFTINITKPDGTTQIIGPFTCSSDVASDWKAFTPDQVGTYTIVFSWPGETVAATAALQNTGSATMNPDNIGDFYMGSTSAPYYLVVKQDPVPIWQEPALPTDYWTRPINDANRGWASLPSNWLLGTWLYQNVQTSGTGPKTAHILWTKPIIPGYPGGISDAQWAAIPADVNDYESPWSSPIIMNGIIYYNSPAVADSDQYGYYATSLYTGEQLWYKNGTDNGLNNPVTIGNIGNSPIGPGLTQQYLRLTLGQLYNYYSVNGAGVLSYLWIQSGTTWYMLDSTTGNLILTLKNVPSGTGASDENGDLLRYTVNTATGNVLCWNSSQAIYPGGVTGTSRQQWKPRIGGVIDAVNDTSWLNGTWSAGEGPAFNALLMKPHSGYTMNVTDASLKGLPGSLSSIITDDSRVPKILLGSNFPITVNTGSSVGLDYFQTWTIKINDHATNYSPNPGYPSNLQTNLGFTTTLLFSRTIPVPILGKNYTWSMTGYSYDDNVFCITCKQTGQVWAYSLTTGDLVWGPTTTLPGGPMAFYGVSTNFYNGMCIVNSGYSGQLAAYDAKTGAPLWTYNSTLTHPYEGYYGPNQPLSVGAICDGMIYTYSTEHSPTKPLWRESYVRCINATDGTEMWKLLDFNMGLSLADGYIVSGSQYDNLVYCIGKGPSATTVTTPDLVPSLGQSVMVKGTVTDQSPGAKGSAAISDRDQQAWMEYLYEDQIKPTNVTGVNVSLDSVDPNGNLVHIADVTTDTTGAYGYKYTPDIAGTYQIIATFKGTDSYGSSSSTAYMGVSDAAPTALPYPEIALPPTETYVVAIGIAIIIAIAIVGTVLGMMIKKRQ